MAGAVEGVGAGVLPLPPDSPDLNPIEEMFSKFKEFLRRAAWTKDHLVETIGEAMRQVSAQDILGWFRQAGPCCNSDVNRSRRLKYEPGRNETRPSAALQALINGRSFAIARFSYEWEVSLPTNLTFQEPSGIVGRADQVRQIDLDDRLNPRFPHGFATANCS